MASTDARPVPQKNVAFRVTLPLIDADGDLVTGATGLDSEISKDAGTFTDCTNEATEIASSSGMYYLDLTSTEMNADCVVIIVKTSSSGAKTTPIVLYPEEAGDIRVNTTQLNGTSQTGRDIGASVLLSSGTGTGQVTLTSGRVNADVTHVGASAITQSGGRLEVNTTHAAGTAWGSGAITAASLGADCITNAKIADNAIAAENIATDAITAAKIAADAIGSSEFAQAAADKVWSTTARVLTAGTNIALAKGTGVTGFNDLSAAQVNSEVDTALADYDGPTNAELVSEINSVQSDIAGLSIPSAATIADAVWDEVLSGHLTGGSTGNALNAAGSAGDPWTTALPGAYGAGSAGKIIGDNINATISSRASQTSVDDVPTNAELTTALGTADDAVLAAIAALNNLSQANVRTALGMASANLDTQLDALPTNAELSTALGTADDAVLAAVAALNNLSSAQVQTAAAAALTAYDPPTRAEVTADKDEVIVQINANETKIDTLQTSVNDVPTNAELTTALGTSDDATLAQIALVKAKTDLIPSDPADQSAVEAAITAATSGLASQSSVNTLAGYVDTEVGAIKAKTDQLTFAEAGVVDANIKMVNDVTVQGTGETGDE